MIELNANFEETLRDLEKVVHVIEPAARRGIIAATGEALKISRDELSASIYNKPETETMRRSRSSGRVRKVKLWKRKSNLLRGERAEYPRPGGKIEGRIHNNVPYAEDRHEKQYPAKTPYYTLEGGGTSKGKSKRKVYKRVAKARLNRQARWREKARDRAESPARSAFEREFNNGMKAGGA